MKPRAPILTFHALDERRSPISFPPDLFERGLRALAAARRPALGALELVAAVEASATSPALPRGAFAITFDDGYRSFYERAFPVLSELGFPATVFVTVDAEAPGSRLTPMSGRDRLAWPEMREMSARGIEFGAHTLSHPDLTTLPEAEIEREIAASKRILEDGLGVAVRTFAYPFGRFDRRVRDVARRHFLAAFTDRLGLVRRGDDRHLLPRVDAFYLRSPRLLARVGSAALAPYLSLRRWPRELRRRWRRR